MPKNNTTHASTDSNQPGNQSRQDSTNSDTIVVGAWGCNAVHSKANAAAKRDNLLSSFRKLMANGPGEGMQIDSLDVMNALSDADAFLFFDFPDMDHPKVKQAFNTNALKFLVTFEPEVARPKNWIAHNTQLFDGIFTLSDDIVDGNRLVKLKSCNDVETIVDGIRECVEETRQPAPLISVAIPAYNYAHYITQTINSVLSQGYDDMELVILNNASTDNTAETVKPFLSDPRVRYFVNETTVPAAENFQKVARLCRGKYLAVLCADDYYLPDHLKTLIPLLEENPQCDLAYTRIQGVNENGEPIPTRGPGDAIRPDSYVGGFNEYIDSLVHGCYINTCAAIIRRDAFRKVGGFDIGLKGAIDYDLCIRLGEQNSNFIFVRKPTLAYRFHGPQYSSHYFSSTEPLEDYLKIVEKALASPRADEVHKAKEGIMNMVMLKLNGTPFMQRINAISQTLSSPVTAKTDTQPESAPQPSSLVEDLLMTRRWDDAIEAINAHLESNPDDAKSLNRLGMAYHGKGDDKSARNAVRQSIDADPTYIDAYYGMAQLLLNDNRAIEAADYAIKAAQIGTPVYGALKTVEDCRKALRTLKQSASKKQGKKAKHSTVQTCDIDTRLCKLGELIECISSQPGLDTGPKQTISLCIIARDEEDMIGDCLASAKDIVDEIVVVDTGSTDATARIATSYGARVTDFEWNECFADARNAAIDQATGDWILMLDADERLDDNARNQITQTITNSETDAYELAFVNYLTGTNTPEVHISRCVRLFRNRPAYRYSGRVHERIAPAIQNDGGIIRLLEATIHHHGYRPEIVKVRGKHERNLSLLEKDLADSPQDVYIIYHIANQYYSEGNHVKAIEYFEQCVPLVLPTHQFKPLLFSNLVDCYMAVGKLQEAIKAIDNASLLRASHPQLLHSKGNAFRMADKFTMAVDAYEAAIELGKRGLWDGDTSTFGYKAHYGAAASYFAIGHYTMAIEHAQKAILSKPGNPESESILAQATAALDANGGQDKEVYESSRSQVQVGETPKLSLCMIVKNEEEFLKGCIDSAKPIVDEIILVDTGSQDRTVEIARECGADVHFFPWNDSFADARNESLEHATGDWILILDADEKLDDNASSIIMDAIKNPTADAYEMFFRNPVSEEKDADFTEHRICRLFRNRPEYRFNSRIHENIETAVGENHGTIGQLRAVIHHMGYAQRLIQERNKGERYTRILEQEVASHPGNIFYMHHLIAAYCAYGLFDKALENLLLATEIAELNNPFTPILWATLVNILVELGRADEALEAAERSLKRGVYQHPQLHFCKANAYTRLERYQEAADSYKKAIEEGRGKTWNGDTQTAGYKADFGIGNAMHKMSRNEEAIPYLLKVIESKPKHVAAHETLTKAYSGAKQMDKYEEQLKVLQTLVPKDPGPSIRLAELCEGRQEIDQARDIYMNIVANIADTAVLEFKLGSFHETLGDAESAEKSYLRAIEIMPDCKDAYSNLGLLLASQERLEEALDCFVKAIDIDPNYANAYFNAGDVLYQAGLYEKSADIYSNGLTVSPNHVPAYFAIGNCYFQLGAYEAAAVAYRETLKIDHSHTGAINNLSLVETALEAVTNAA